MLTSTPRTSVGLCLGIQGSFNILSNIPGHLEEALLMFHRLCFPSGGKDGRTEHGAQR